MKIYYEVYENAKVNHPITGARVNGNKLILTTKSRTKALDLYAKNERARWVEEITTDSEGCETSDIITGPYAL
jgi:hypothetical protein